MSKLNASAIKKNCAAGELAGPYQDVLFVTVLATST